MFTSVRLPGAGRLLAVRSVDVFRARPPGSHLHAPTAASDSERAYACYSIEAQFSPSADSDTFLEEVKMLDYTVSTDPTDPIFYSTCMMYRIVTEWFPIDDDAKSAETAVLRQWNFSGWCLDCDSYYQNYLNRTKPSLDDYHTPQCKDFSSLFFCQPFHSPVANFSPPYPYHHYCRCREFYQPKGGSTTSAKIAT